MSDTSSPKPRRKMRSKSDERIAQLENLYNNRKRLKIGERARSKPNVPHVASAKSSAVELSSQPAISSPNQNQVVVGSAPIMALSPPIWRPVLLCHFDITKAGKIRVVDAIHDNNAPHLVVRSVIENIKTFFDSDFVKNLSEEEDSDRSVTLKRMNYLKNIGPNFGTYLELKGKISLIADVDYDVPSLTAYLNCLNIPINDFIKLYNICRPAFNLIYRYIPDFLCHHLWQKSPKSTLSRISGSLREKFGVIVDQTMHTLICNRCDAFWRENNYEPTRANVITKDYYNALSKDLQAKCDIIIAIGNRLGNVEAGEINGKFKARIENLEHETLLHISWNLRPSENKIRNWSGGRLVVSSNDYPLMPNAVKAIYNMISNREIFPTAWEIIKSINNSIKSQNPEWFSDKSNRKKKSIAPWDTSDKSEVATANKIDDIFHTNG